MKYKKSMFIVLLAIFLFSLTGVFASEMDTPVASEDTGQVELSVNEEGIEDNLQTGEENPVLTFVDDEETLSVQTDTEVLGADSATYSDLANEISQSGSVKLAHKNYTYDGSPAITISEDNKVIDGDGAVIDMAGSTIRAFTVSASGVTIKNLTIKNANYNGDGGGGAIYFTTSGAVINCYFINNHANEDGGAIYCNHHLEVQNCLFDSNQAKGSSHQCYGGAIRTVSIRVDGSRFINNCAEDYGGAIYAEKVTLTSIPSYFIGNVAEDDQGGAIYTDTFTNDVSNIVFINNKATNDDGGAIYINGETHVTFHRCVFVDNYCGDEGGAIYLGSSTEVSLRNNIFVNNRAGDVGHAVYNYGTFGDIYNNWWGDRIPSTDNDVLYEWGHINPSKIDIVPLHIELRLSKNSADVYEVVRATLCYVGSDGIRLQDGLSGDVSFNVPEVISQHGNDIYFTSNKTGLFDITVNIYGHSLTQKINFNAIDPEIKIDIDSITEGSNATISITTNKLFNGEVMVLIDGENYTVEIINGVGSCNVSGLKVGLYTATVMFNQTEAFQASSKTSYFAVFREGEGSYSDLRNEIGNGGDIVLTKNYYRYIDGDGETIEITTPGVIDGRGAVIDMAGFNLQALKVEAFGVIIKNLTIKNVNYDGFGGAIYFKTSGTVTNCSFTDNKAWFGGAIYFTGNGNVVNCSFTDNKVSLQGGAIYFTGNGNVVNCSFTDNNASFDGGAVYISSTGNVTNCSFTNNNAARGGAIYFENIDDLSNCNFTDNTAMYGGAVYVLNGGNMTDCNFTGNNATNGSAIYYSSESATKTVSNSCFLNNMANAGSLVVTKNDNNITIIFTGLDNLLNAIYSQHGSEVTFNNVAYWGKNGIATVSATMSGSDREAGQNITVGVVVNDNLVLNDVMVTDENGMIVLDISAGENYYIHVRHDADSYYTEAEGKIGNNTKFYVNVTSQTTTKKTVNITAESNIPNGAVQGKLLFILPDGTNITANYVGNGTWWAIHEFDDYGIYQVNATYLGLDDVTITNGTIRASKLLTEIRLENSTLELFVNDSVGIGATLIPADAGNLTYTSSNSSVAIVENGKIKALAAGSANITVSFAGDDTYAAINRTIVVTVSLRDASVSVNNDTLDLFVGDEFIVVVSKVPEDLDVTFTPDNSGVVSVDENGVITALKEGSATVKVSVGGDGVYALNTTDVTVIVKKIPTEIIVNNEYVELLVGDSVDAGATLTPADAGNLTFTSSNITVVKVEDGKIMAVGEGNAIITVSFAGNDKYAVAENKTISVTVSLRDASVSVNNDTLDLFVGDEFVLVVTTGPEDLDVTFTPDNSGVVSVDENGVVTALKEGSATVKVSVGGDGVYTLNTTEVSITVKKIPTEIVVNNVTLDLFVGNSVGTGASLTPADAGNLTFTSSNITVVKVEDGKIIAVGEGNAIITVSFAGNDKYAVAENKTISVTVNLNDASVNVNNVTLDLFVGDEFVLVVTADPEDLDVTFTPDNSGVVSVDENGVIRALNEGSATVKVSVGGDGVYALNTTEVSVTVKKIPTEIIVNNATLDLLVGDVVEGVASLKPFTGDNLTYISSNPDIVKVEDGKLVAVATGTATVMVSYAGDYKYVAAENKTIEVTVKYDSKVTISPINDSVYPNNVIIKYSVENRTDVIVNIDGVSDDKIVITDDTITVIGLGAGEYTITVINNESNIYLKSNDTKTFTVNKQTTSIEAAAISTTYNSNKDLVITLKDSNGKALSGVKVSVDLNGAKTYTTDKNGQIKISIKALTPKTYAAKITFNGNTNYAGSFKNVKVTVKKATPKMTAKKKTFKSNVKTKKYTIVLKDNTGKAIKKAKVTLKIKGKTYKATTNSKGKATFKIKKLTKKGTYKAVIKYKGNKYYNKLTKKVKIKVIVKFKTVSKGSKDKATVKKIQRALKNKGYYLSYKGHYLKVDGKFNSCTFRSVKEFQKDKGLKVTGKVDERTAKKLGII